MRTARHTLITSTESMNEGYSISRPISRSRRNEKHPCGSQGRLNRRNLKAETTRLSRELGDHDQIANIKNDILWRQIARVFAA